MFFFKQKTAYDMRISDWSSDVCSSDLRYNFSDVDVQSEIRDFQPEMLKKLLPMKTGDWYDAKLVEDTVESLSETAGLFGYAFADINPEFRRNPEDRRSEEHTSELQSLMRISYAVFCLKKKTTRNAQH